MSIPVRCLLFSILLLSGLSAYCQKVNKKPIILLLHGRGQDATDQDGKKAATLWESFLRSGLLNQSITAQDYDLEFGWYGDLLGKEGINFCTHHEFLPQERLDQYHKYKHTAIQTVFNALDNLPFGKSYFLSQVMPDVKIYLSDQHNQCAINDRVEKALEKVVKEERPVIIIAHSMGSLVAYNILNRDSRIMPRIKDIELITIGSMLGMVGVRKALLGEYMTFGIVVPSSILRWANVVNIKDYLSFSLNGKMFSQNDLNLPIDHRVSLQSGHDALGYLSSPEVAKLIKEAIKR